MHRIIYYKISIFAVLFGIQDQAIKAWFTSKRDETLFCDQSKKLQGVPKKMLIMSGFEFLTFGEVFLGVTFYQKTFLFYKIFLVSKQNFEKMAPISWNINTNIASIWFFKLQNVVKYVKMLMKSIILLKFILGNW